jgi:ribosomal protein S27E
MSEMIENDIVLKLACGHCYHYDCVHSWLSKNNTCPLCRSEMPIEEERKKQFKI